jgi:hypothetical protein
VHEEPAEVITPDEAAAIEELQMAGRIERLLGMNASLSHTQEMTHASSEQDDVLLLTFNRFTEAMLSELSNGVSLCGCRTNLAAAGLNWKLPTRTLVFVHPQQYTDVMRAIVGLELKGHHVIIARSFEHLLEESIARVWNCCLKGSWVKERSELGPLEPLRASSVSDMLNQEDREFCNQIEPCKTAEWWEAVPVERTFIHLQFPRKDPASVVQSTTEANPRAGVNPRRNRVWQGTGLSHQDDGTSPNLIEHCEIAEKQCWDVAGESTLHLPTDPQGDGVCGAVHD